MSAVQMGQIESAFYAQLGAKIEIERKRKEMSRNALAIEIGVHRNTLMRWETGEFACPIWMLLRICDVLHCSHVMMLPDREYTWGRALSDLERERDPVNEIQNERDAPIGDERDGAEAWFAAKS